MACFKLIFPVTRKSAPSWREEPATARRVPSQRRPCGSETQVLWAQTKCRSAFSNGIVAYSEAETWFTCFSSPSFSGRLNASKKQQRRFPLIAAAREEIDDALAQ
jgi:hypothetical protein